LEVKRSEGAEVVTVKIAVSQREHSATEKNNNGYKTTKRKQRKTMNSNDNTEEVTMTKAQLMELIRVVVIETVREVKQYEADAIEAMQEEEEAEEANEKAMAELRTRAAYLASGMKKNLICNVKPIDNSQSVELFILSDDNNNGNSIRLELDRVILRHNGAKMVWEYSDRNSYQRAASEAVKQLRDSMDRWGND
jgi:hypothetical protein